MAKGVSREPLEAMIRDEGSRLRTADGVTVLHDTDARYFPSKGTVRGIVDRATRERRLHRFDQPAVEEYVKRRRQLHPTEKWFFQPSNGSNSFSTAVALGRPHGCTCPTHPHGAQSQPTTMLSAR